MKLQLLHGPGIISSRAKLQAIKKQFDASNIVVFGPESSYQQIMGSLLTPSLFSGDRLIILENPPEDLQFSIYNFQFTIVFWFDHEIDIKSPLLKSVKEKRGEILFFDISKEASVFPFLDYLANKDNKAFLEMQKLETSGFDVFYILNMVFYLLRSLSLTPKNAPEFVKKKLAKQRTNFMHEEIKNIYKGILEIEFGLKSGLVDQSQAKFLLVLKFLHH